MIKYPSKLVCALLILFSTGVHAQNTQANDNNCAVYDQSSGYCDNDYYCCGQTPKKTHAFDLYGFYSFGESPGICEHYGSAGVFAGCCLEPCSYGIVYDAAYHFLHNGNAGASGGVGFRFAGANNAYVGGFNVFYDYLEGDVTCFHQVGVGLEIIGNCFEARVNGYFPVSDQLKKGPTSIFDDYDNSGAALPYFASAFKEEYALTGFDSEIGLGFCCSGFSGFFGVGGYYFEHDDLTNYWGAKGRIRFEYRKIISMSGQVTWDEKHKTEGRGQIEIRLPLAMLCNACSLWKCPCKSERRIYRDYPVHLERCCRYTTNY